MPKLKGLILATLLLCATNASAAIFFVGGGGTSVAQVGINTPCAVNVPTGTIPGDTMIGEDVFDATQTVACPTGWSQVRLDTGAFQKLLSCSKIAGIEPASYSWAAAGTTSLASCSISTWRGASVSSPTQNGGTNNTPVTAISFAQLTTLANGAVMVNTGAWTCAAGCTVTPAGTFSATIYNDARGAATIGLFQATQNIPTAGTLSTTGGSNTSDTANTLSATLELDPFLPPATGTGCPNNSRGSTSMLYKGIFDGTLSQSCGM